MKAQISIPNGYGARKSTCMLSTMTDDISPTHARVYKGWIPKAFYKMTIPGMENVQTKNRQRVIAVPSTVPVEKEVPLLWLASAEGEIFSLCNIPMNSNIFSILVKTPDGSFYVQQWEGHQKKEVCLLTFFGPSRVPLTFLWIPGIYLILDDQGSIYIISEKGECMQTLSSISNPIVGLTKIDGSAIWRDLQDPVIAISYLFGDIKLFTLNNAGLLTIRYVLQSGLFSPVKMVSQDSYLFVASRSSQYGIFNLTTRSSLYCSAAVAPIIDLCIACEHSMNYVFCLLTENSRLVMLVPPINIIQQSNDLGFIPAGDFLKVTTHTLIFGRGEEFSPTALAVTYSNGLATVFVTTTGGHVFTRRLGIVHDLTSEASQSFKLDSEAASFLQVTKGIAPYGAKECAQLIEDVFVKSKDAPEKNELIVDFLRRASESPTSYHINFDLLPYSAVPELMGYEEKLNSVMILSEVLDNGLYWIKGVVTSATGLLLWFKLPFLNHNICFAKKQS